MEFPLIPRLPRSSDVLVAGKNRSLTKFAGKKVSDLGFYDFEQRDLMELPNESSRIQVRQVAPYTITAHTRLIRSEGELYPGYREIVVVARDETGKVVGYSTGQRHDLRLYATQLDFTFAMDAVDGVMYDSGCAIEKHSHAFWRSRDLLCLALKTEVLPAHRGRGLGRSLSGERIRALAKSGRCMDVLLQPFPIQFCPSDHTSERGRRPITNTEFAESLASLMRYWQKCLPYLKPMKGEIGFDRRTFLFGRVPSPTKIE